MHTDLYISNSNGFYMITSSTPKGRWWLKRNVHNVESGVAYCDDSRYAEAVYRGALECGLTVTAEKAY